MTTHMLKIWPQYFAAVMDGTKTFEVRKDDRGYTVGDMLVLREWEVTGIVGRPSGIGGFRDVGGYTGRECQHTVAYILRDVPGIEDGYVVMGLSSPRMEALERLYDAIKSVRVIESIPRPIHGSPRQQDEHDDWFDENWPPAQQRLNDALDELEAMGDD